MQVKVWGFYCFIGIEKEKSTEDSRKKGRTNQEEKENKIDKKIVDWTALCNFDRYKKLVKNENFSF